MIFYVDGACSGNGSTYATGGFGVVGLIDNIGVYYYAIGCKETTNNREELKAILHVLMNFGTDGEEECPIVYSDSAYAVNTLTNWMFKWADNDWTKSDGKAPENLDLITIYYNLWQFGLRINLKKVKGHDGNYWNEVADEMAKRAKDKQIEIMQKIDKIK